MSWELFLVGAFLRANSLQPTWSRSFPSPNALVESPSFSFLGRLPSSSALMLTRLVSFLVVVVWEVKGRRVGGQFARCGAADLSLAAIANMIMQGLVPLGGNTFSCTAAGSLSRRC